MLDLDALALLPREVLRERAAELVAETCAWSVGLSDAPHLVPRDGRLVPSGSTLGDRAETGQQLGPEGAGRLDLTDARPGTFRDALNALTRDGRLLADRFDDEVLTGFVADTATAAVERFREESPEDWLELLDELGEDGDDLAAVARALDWDAPLRADAEELVLSALGEVPLVEVEREGVPLSVVRAAEGLTREAVREDDAAPQEPDDAVMFLALAALDRAALARPVRPADAVPLLEALQEEGLEPQEIRLALPHLPVLADTAERLEDLLSQER